MLFLNMATIHTTATSATNALLDLYAKLEYMLLLREEILQAVQEDSSIKASTMTKLKIMDSFMNGSTRLNPLGLCKSFEPYM
jgi:hypothetical protein